MNLLGSQCLCVSVFSVSVNCVAKLPQPNTLCHVGAEHTFTSIPTVRLSGSIRHVWSRGSNSACSRLVLPCIPSPSRNTRASCTFSHPCSISSRRNARTGTHPFDRISSGGSGDPGPPAVTPPKSTSHGSTSCHHSRYMDEQTRWNIVLQAVNGR